MTTLPTTTELYQIIFGTGKKDDFKASVMRVFLNVVAKLEQTTKRKFLNINAKNEDIFLTYEALSANIKESKLRKTSVPKKAKNPTTNKMEKKLDANGQPEMEVKAAKLKEPISIGVNFTKTLQFILASALHDAQVFALTVGKQTSDANVFDEFTKYVAGTTGVARFLMFSYNDDDFAAMTSNLDRLTLDGIAAPCLKTPLVSQFLLNAIAKRVELFIIKLASHYATRLDESVSIAEISKKELTEEEKKKKAEEKKKKAEEKKAESKDVKVKETKAKKVSNPDERSFKADPNDIIAIIKDELARLRSDETYDIKPFTLEIIDFIKKTKKTVSKRGPKKTNVDMAPAIANATTLGQSQAALITASAVAASTTAPATVTAATSAVALPAPLPMTTAAVAALPMPAALPVPVALPVPAALPVAAGPLTLIEVADPALPAEINANSVKIASIKRGRQRTAAG